jgi:glucosyl-dolichyl phosphate glucuronosyltransferase
MRMCEQSDGQGTIARPERDDLTMPETLTMQNGVPQPIPVTSQPACDISVVVPTYNRRQLLAKTLESLIGQRAASVRYEVLVVDNNSTDDTRSVVETFTQRWSAIRYLFEPRRGVSHARNTGIAAASAPIVAFIDDDVEADPSWIRNIKQAFDDHPDIDCLGGAIRGHFPEQPPAWFTPSHWAPLALQEDKRPTWDAEHASGCLPTANFACRRAALEEVGGFAPEFLRSQDHEIELRLWAAGKRGLYVPEIVVTTEVPRERLTKKYHRRFHWQTGRYAERMRYRDLIDRDGRLLREPPRTATLLGAPVFVYRDLSRQIAGWLWSVARFRWSDAFYHETRVLYFASYIWNRYRREGPRLWAIPFELSRSVAATIQNRIERRVRVRENASGSN